MSTGTRKIPRTYAALCAELGFPRSVKNKAQRKRLGKVVQALAMQNLNADQEEYLADVCARIASYDKPAMGSHWFSQGTPTDALVVLCEEHSLNATGLGKILGSGRAVGSRLLNGTRLPSKAQVKLLAEYFECSPAVFL